jgi:hypothetical protein
MLNFIRVRLRGACVARKVRASIARNWSWEQAGEVVGPHGRGTSLTRDGVLVTITPRRLRIFDRVNLYYKGGEVWLPLIARIRLRNAVRLYMIELVDARANVSGSEANNA